MRHALVNALRSRGLDVATALEAGMIHRIDEDHLNFATRQERVLFTFNRGDFLRLHGQYVLQGRQHAGIIVANQQQYSVGEVMRRLLHLSAAKTSDDMKNWIEFLSAWG